ncbi:hypothetical protein [Micromonospora sp. WMMC250]|uniref:hypothetical protein n=1 Tax=Micromonospora sp. WMMC250 TaxID=3014781 RepID=UPI0022B6040D|nr:hypothetical protein [Micromonospora sp. WMMC250]MCZ7379423.1 hypothetical protein [Micromonospora sp. WMMC250]
MTDLPNGWAVASLAELIDADGIFVDGDWVESKDQDPDGEVRLVQLADIGDGNFRNRSNRSLTRQKAAELRCTQLNSGDVLVARMPDPLGRACIYPGGVRPAVTVVDVCIIRTTVIDPTWLMWALNSPQVREQVAGYQSGTTRKRISRGNLARVRLWLPPLAEQRRIAGALDIYLSHLRAGRRELKAIATRAQALGAVSANDAARFNSSEMVSFGELIADARGGWSRNRGHLVPAGIGVGYLKMNNVTSGGELDLGSVAYVEADGEDLRRYGVVEGDLLFNNKNSLELVGKSAIVTASAAGFVFNENLTRIRLSGDVLPRFAVMQINSPNFRRSLATIKSATTNVAAIYMKDLRRVPFWVPPLQKQAEILRGCDEVRALSRSLQNSAHSASHQGEALGVALLADAFAGKLVPQDSSDEPASELLASIRAARAAALPKQKTRSRRTHKELAAPPTRVTGDDYQQEALPL